MKLKNEVVLITGANRGLGLAFAREALARGAKKVYAAARNPESVALPGVVPVKLDVTRAEDAVALAKLAGDVTVVVNNAGIATMGAFLTEGSVEASRRHFETNFIGVLQVSQAFAPVLAKNGGGALLNVLSVASFVNSPPLSTYAASKAATWSLTNGLRTELAGQKTQVLGLHVGFVDTDLVRDVTAPKSDPAVVVARAFDALEAGKSEVFADDFSLAVKQGLSSEHAPYLGSRR